MSIYVLTGCRFPGEDDVFDPGVPGVPVEGYGVAWVDWENDATADAWNDTDISGVDAGIGDIYLLSEDDGGDHREKPISFSDNDDQTAEEQQAEVIARFQTCWALFNEQGYNLGTPQIHPSDGQVHLWGSVWAQNLSDGDIAVVDPWGVGISTILVSKNAVGSAVYAVTGPVLEIWDIGPQTTGAPLENFGFTKDGYQQFQKGYVYVETKNGIVFTQWVAGGEVPDWAGEELVD